MTFLELLDELELGGVEMHRVLLAGARARRRAEVRVAERRGGRHGARGARVWNGLTVSTARARTRACSRCFLVLRARLANEKKDLTILAGSEKRDLLPLAYEWESSAAALGSIVASSSGTTGVLSLELSAT